MPARNKLPSTNWASFEIASRMVIMAICCTAITTSIAGFSHTVGAEFYRFIGFSLIPKWNTLAPSCFGHFSMTIFANRHKHQSFPSTEEKISSPKTPLSFLFISSICFFSVSKRSFRSSVSVLPLCRKRSQFSDILL